MLFNFTCMFANYCRYELLFYPRYHLDQSSLLCRKVLLGKPMVMDVYQDYILVSYLPFFIHVYHVKIYGELTPSSKADLQVVSYSGSFLLCIIFSKLYFLTSKCERLSCFSCTLKWLNDKQLSTVRELSIMTAKSHPAAMGFVPDQHLREGELDNDNLSSDLSDREPSR